MSCLPYHRVCSVDSVELEVHAALPTEFCYSEVVAYFISNYVVSSSTYGYGLTPDGFSPTVVRLCSTCYHVHDLLNVWRINVSVVGVWKELKSQLMPMFLEISYS